MNAPAFRYLGFEVDPAAGEVRCSYGLGDRTFTEVVGFPASRGSAAWDDPAALAAARWVFLLAGVSYYKAAAPEVIDLGDTAVTGPEREFLRTFYLEGLGEFAHRNGLDLSGLRLVGPDACEPAVAGYRPASGRPLIPFGGGIDSIVSVELVRPLAPEAALFVMGRPGDRFAAIEAPAAGTGLPVLRAERALDPQILRSRELGFRNGHVPVTGILSAVAVLAAVLDGRDAVVMSNEWSASSATLTVDARDINHQWSKGEVFEREFRRVLAASVGGLEYFSLLRPFTELWIAREFAASGRYLTTFRSCNRAFHLDPASRWETWCGECDKCCFIDLILAPFTPAARLREVFGGREPLERQDLLPTFRNLLALTPDAKPWECVGDEVECRIAARLAAQRPDRAGSAVLATLVGEAAGRHDPDPEALLRPVAASHVPDRYQPAALRG